MIDVSKEQVIPVHKVTDYLPSSRRGKKLSPSQVCRMYLRGIHGIRLETLRVGRSRLTSVEAIQRFVDRLNRTNQDDAQPTPATRSRATARAARAARELDSLL
jgi:Protein of unknown function (DUF1580)